jgi:hypothetical protein
VVDQVVDVEEEEVVVVDPDIPVDQEWVITHLDRLDRTATVAAQEEEEDRMALEHLPTGMETAVELTLLHLKQHMVDQEDMGMPVYPLTLTLEDHLHHHPIHTGMLRLQQHMADTPHLVRMVHPHRILMRPLATVIIMGTGTQAGMAVTAEEVMVDMAVEEVEAMVEEDDSQVWIFGIKTILIRRAGGCMQLPLSASDRAH